MHKNSHKRLLMYFLISSNLHTAMYLKIMSIFTKRITAIVKYTMMN